MTATRRPVVVQIHGEAPFSGRRPVVHQDDRFISRPLTMDVCNHFTLDEICSFHGGVTGMLTRRIARPMVRRDLVDGDCQADAEIRDRMTKALEPELDKLVVALNQIPPLVMQANELLILENKTPREQMRFYRAASKEYLIFSIGGPDRHTSPTCRNLEMDNQAALGVVDCRVQECAQGGASDVHVEAMAPDRPDLRRATSETFA